MIEIVFLFVISLAIALAYFVVYRKVYYSYMPYSKALSFKVGKQYRLNKHTYFKTVRVDRGALNVSFYTNNFGGIGFHTHDFSKDILVMKGTVSLTITDGLGHKKTTKYNQGDLFQVGVFTLNSIKAETKEAEAYITCYNPSD